jgi:hypothetical protein
VLRDPGAERRIATARRMAAERTSLDTLTVVSSRSLRARAAALIWRKSLELSAMEKRLVMVSRISVVLVQVCGHYLQSSS